MPEYFFICIINSTFMSHLVNDFVNSTQTFQINDARQIPVVIPTNQELKKFENLFQKALKIKQAQFSNKFKKTEVENWLLTIQTELDKMVYKLYGII